MKDLLSVPGADRVNIPCSLSRNVHVVGRGINERNTAIARIAVAEKLRARNLRRLAARVNEIVRADFRGYLRRSVFEGANHLARFLTYVFTS